MSLAESASCHLRIALREKILTNQTLYVARVAGHSLHGDLMCRASYPVLCILAPVAKDLLVDFVLWRPLTVNARGEGSSSSI